MSGVSFLLLLALPVGGLTLPVSPVGAQKGGSVLLRKDRPSVYIEFERSGKAPPLFEGEREERIWLRLSNNTRWAISFCSLSVGKPYGDVGIVYDVKRYSPLSGMGESRRLGDMPETKAPRKESETPPQGYSTGDTCTPYRLAAGKSAVFSVPRGHLAENLFVHIEFWPEWENRDNELANYPQSYVSFSHSALPTAERHER